MDTEANGNQGPVMQVGIADVAAKLQAAMSAGIELKQTLIAFLKERDVTYMPGYNDGKPNKPQDLSISEAIKTASFLIKAAK
jgi:hypothetical protein